MKTSKNTLTLSQLDKEISLCQTSLSVLQFDKETLLAPHAVEFRSEQIAQLAYICHQKKTHSSIPALIKKKPKNTVEKARILKYTQEYAKDSLLPATFVSEFARQTSRAQSAWEKARIANDFSLFAPQLDKVIALSIKKAQYLKPLYPQTHQIYDILLDQYEQGITQQILDPLFASIQTKLLSILRTVRQSEKYQQTKDESSIVIPQTIQTAIVQKIISCICPTNVTYAQTTHPFMSRLGPSDVRIAIAFRESDPFFAWTSTAHEAGHALYEVQFNPAYEYSILADGASYGTHESQSRLWENHICKSKAFVQAMQPVLESAGVTIPTQELYMQLNKIQPTLIRIQGDELSYCLHIIIRYEIEQLLFSKKITAKDIPKVWNQKYLALFGRTPKNATEGCLQDVHWSCGYFGYFPTYALGTIWSAQLYETLAKQYPIEQEISRLDFWHIRDWLKRHIHQYGASKSGITIMQQAVQGPIDIRPYINYLKEKYFTLYECEDVKNVQTPTGIK
jgi:carboxypeptidase Taq